MKLQPLSTPGIHLFTAYGSGYVAVNQQPHRENLLVLPQSLRPAWTNATPCTLADADMAVLLALGVDIILLGTGSRLVFPPPALLRPFPAARIGLEVMDREAACRTYNILAAEGRQVAAALLFDPPQQNLP